MSVPQLVEGFYPRLSTIWSHDDDDDDDDEPVVVRLLTGQFSQNSEVRLWRLNDNFLYILAFAFLNCYIGGLVLSSQPFACFVEFLLVVSAALFVSAIPLWSLRPFRSFRFLVSDFSRAVSCSLLSSVG